MTQSDLDRIRDAIERGDAEKARKLLRAALQHPSADTYYLASQVALNASQRIQFLEQALELDPFHQPAADTLGTIRSTGAEVLSIPASGVRPDGEALPGYDKKRLAPLVAIGIMGGAAMVLLPSADEQAAAILGILVAVAYVVTIAVLIVQHGRSLLESRRWSYQLKIAVLFATVFLTSAIWEVIRIHHVSNHLLLFLVIAGGAWAVFAIVGGGILYFSRRNNG